MPLHTSYSRSVSPATSPPGRVFPWLILLLGVCTILLGGLGLWNGLTFAFQGQSATGRVLEFHQTASRSASIVGQVDVTLPGRAPFRAEVDDATGAQDWEVGKTVSLRCAAIHGPDYLSCSATSGWAVIAVPLLFIGIGLLMVWWGQKRIRGV